jgi:hypothetical protein
MHSGQGVPEMGKITVDAELTARFQTARDQVEVCDENGRAIGVFLPWELFQTIQKMKEVAYANIQIPFSDEEITRLRSEKEVSSLADFWQRMGQK